MSSIQKKIVPPWHKSYLAKYIKSKRLRFINKLFGGNLLSASNQNRKILDVGCSTGKDFIKHFEHRIDMDLYGLNVRDH